MHEDWNAVKCVNVRPHSKNDAKPLPLSENALTRQKEFTYVSGQRQHLQMKIYLCTSIDDLY